MIIKKKTLYQKKININKSCRMQKKMLVYATRHIKLNMANMFVSIKIFGGDWVALPCFYVSLLSKVITGALNFALLSYLYDQIYFSSKNCLCRRGFSHFTLSFCRGWQRNVQRFITHLFDVVLVAVAVTVCLRFLMYRVLGQDT